MEVLVIAFLTILNGLFSLSEIALASVKPSRIQARADQGDPRARKVQDLLAHPEGFLSSIQVGITVIGIVSGVFGGATLTEDLAAWFVSWNMVPAYAHSLALVLVIGTITYFTIVIGELVPKTVALNNPEGIALAAAPWVTVFTRVAFPLVKLLSISTQTILRLLGVKERKGDRISAEELRAMIRTANLQGLLDQEESQAHHNLLQFDEQLAKTLMTPRGQVEWINSEDSLPEIMTQVKCSVRSKYPVASGSLDEIIGCLSIRDLLAEADAADFALEQVVRPAVMIPDSATPFTILQQFRKSKQYLGLVVDEHGHFEGLLTLHDLTEAIVGDLPSQDEDGGPEIVQRPDGSWLVGGRVPIGELNTHLGRRLIAENPGQYTTVAGYFLTRFKYIPEAGSRFVDELLEGEVVDMDGHRIDKVLLIPKQASATA